MTAYKYIVNTFDNDLNPIQIVGMIHAEDEDDVIYRLKDGGIVNRWGYEFLEIEEDER